MFIKSFLLNSRNIKHDIFFWNMLGSMLMAFQSVIMLVILTHILSLYEAGLFTIAYANANLFLNIGKFGMRNYQVSDINEHFSFQVYCQSRKYTTIVMIITFLSYSVFACLVNHYSTEKFLIIILMCLFKVIDSIEDVFHARYQQLGRLDVAGKALTLRMILSILIFTVSLILTKSLLISLITTTIISAIICIIFIKFTYPMFIDHNVISSSQNTFTLLKNCFPLFLGNFLAFYIGNAPKYAIDTILNDELQACYGFIAMPVFVIGLLNNFIFNPMITKLSVLWNNHKISDFLKMTLQQVIIIALITLVCEIGAYFLGIPVLSLLYNTDLSNYKIELIILLLGGGFLALSGLLATIITIIRVQQKLAIGYILISVIALCCSRSFVRHYSILGAAFLYLALMFLLCIIFTIILIKGIISSNKDRKTVHTTD